MLHKGFFAVYLGFKVHNVGVSNQILGLLHATSAEIVSAQVCKPFSEEATLT